MCGSQARHLHPTRLYRFVAIATRPGCSSEMVDAVNASSGSNETRACVQLLMVLGADDLVLALSVIVSAE